jgi:hypothetical protein
MHVGSSLNGAPQLTRAPVLPKLSLQAASELNVWVTANALVRSLSRKEPLNNASAVRNAIARFDQIQGLSDVERD